MAETNLRTQLSFAGMRSRRLAVRIAMVLASSVLGGCALVSVNLKGPTGACGIPASTGQPEVKAGQRPVAYCADPQDALKYAAGWRQVFLNAAGQHSAARNSTALIGIPAAAVAGFYGTSGHGSTDRISRLSFGAAGVYSANAFLAPQGKQRAYLEGALALSCLMDRAVPYHVGSDRQRTLTDLIQRAQRELDDLQTAIDGSGLPGDSPTMARALVVRGDATNLLVGARAVRDAHEKSGLRIGIAVDRIVAQTAQLASSQESNLNSLLAMAGGIRGSAGQFGLSNLPPLNLANAAAGETENVRDPAANARAARIQQAERTLEDKLTRLHATLRQLKVAMLDMEPPQELPEFGAICSPDTAAVGFSVTPAEVAQTVKVDETLEFKITNSRSDAFATYTLTNNGANAVVASGPEVKNGKLTITIAGKKVTGATPVILFIDDPTGTIRKRYEISVLPKQ